MGSPGARGTPAEYSRMSPGARSSGILSWWTEPAPGAAHEPPLASAHAVAPPRRNGTCARSARARSAFGAGSALAVQPNEHRLHPADPELQRRADARERVSCRCTRLLHSQIDPLQQLRMESTCGSEPTRLSAQADRSGNRIGVAGAGAGVGRSGARTCSWNEHSHLTMPSLASNERGGGSSAPRTRGGASVRPDVLNGCERSLTCRINQHRAVRLSHSIVERPGERGSAAHP